MNDARLTEQLRALRQPPPNGGFEARLQQALWREAQALRVERAPVRPVAGRRLLRWGGRMGIGVAVALGATAAAAAAGGIWAFVAERAPEPPAVEAVPESAAAVRAGQRRGAPSRELAPAASEPAAPLAPAAEALEAAPAAVPVPVASPSQGPFAADEARAAPRRSTSLPSRALVAPLPAAPARAAASTKGGKTSAAGVAPQSSLVPFDLPERAKAAPSLPRPATDRGARVERAAPAGAERRARQDVPVRGEGRRARPERERGAWPPGREIARERSARDNAERGQERAREARERK